MIINNPNVLWIKKCIKHLPSKCIVEESESVQFSGSYRVRIESESFVAECTIWGNENSEIMLASVNDGCYLISRDNLSINSEEFIDVIEQFMSYFGLNDCRPTIL